MSERPRRVRSAALFRAGAWSSVLCAAAVATGACRRPPPLGTRDRDASSVSLAVGDERVPDVVADVVVAPVVARFEPRWACRVTGPGHFGPRPVVAVPAARPGAPAGSIADTVVLRDGSRLAREPVVEGGRTVLARGRVTRTPPRGEGVSRVYDVAPDAVEMLFEDAAGAGVAFLEPAGSIVVLRLGATTAETLVEHAGDLSRPCAGPVTDALRLVPIAARPWEFPRVTGIPPSVADARWTLSRDPQGLCVARLEGEGPWGRVLVAAAPNGMRGELSLAESLNPVECGPAVAPDAGTH